MNRFLSLPTTLLFAGASIVAAAGATEIRLLPAVAGDLTPQTLTSNPTKALGPEIERAPIAISWLLDSSAAIATPSPQRQTSKEYWVEASGAELERGFAIYTTAPGALVRINPVDPSDKAAAIALDGLTLRTTTGSQLTGIQAFSLAVADADLKAAGAAFAEGTVAFRLAADAGDGELTLRSNAAKAAAGYVVHVLDAASDISLGAATAALDLVAGDTVRVAAGVDQAGRALAATVAGFVTSPDGEVFELRFTARGGQALGKLPLTSCLSERPGLWEVHASARAEVDGKVALRSVRTAFSCAEATARLTGEVHLGGPSLDAGALIARIGVEAAADGRYEVRGVLFGTNASGHLVPGAVADSAAWLEAGNGELRLIVDGTTLAATGLGAPFEVRDLTLIDQGRLGILHRQARGFVVPN